MKRTITIFLQGVIFLIAIAVFAGMLWFPQTEGRATNLDLISIYADPLIIYTYIASIPFFITLYHTGKLLGLIANNKVFTQSAVKTVKNIKYCILALPVLIIIGQAIIILNANGDDFAGPVALGIYATFACIISATAVALFQKRIQKSTKLRIK